MQLWAKIAVCLIAILVGGYLGWMAESKGKAPPSKVSNVLDPPKMQTRPAGSGGPNVGVAN